MSGLLVGVNDLATVNPIIAARWHPTKNGELTATQVTARSGKKVWWLGKCGHEWESTVDNQTKSKNCPYCAGVRVLEGFNDLATVNPLVAAQWHPTKNGELIPTQLVAGASRMVWWMCSMGHEWEKPPRSRKRSHRCPVCSGHQVLVGFNDLASLNPVLSKEWHPTKNKLTPEQIFARSGSKVWWLGSCGHEWESAVSSRAKGSGCLVCSGRSVLVGFNDLATVNPELASEWHPLKNKQHSEQFTAGSNKKVWWLGKCGHEWETVISNRSVGNGCPYCIAHRLLVGFNDLATVNPELAAEWHPTKNSFSNRETTAGSHSKAWWIGKCGHEWESVISSRNSGTGCPICSGRDIHTGFNDLATVNPELAAEWHPTKNKELTPQEIIVKSSQKVWWLGNCNHEWLATPRDRFNGVGCYVCSGYKILDGFNDLATINPKLAAQWHPTKNGSLLPQHVARASGTKVWWLCDKGHEWEAPVSGRSRAGANRGCPVCVNQKVLSGFNDLATTHPEIAAEWHPTKNEKLIPENVIAGSNKKVWWLCDKNHEWEAVMSSRTGAGHGCPVCVNQKVLSGFNDLATTHPEIAAEWHPTKNGELSVHHVVAATSKRAWWLGACGHEWEASIRARTRKKPTGCCFCSGREALLGFNDLTTTNPVLAAQWHPMKNGKLIPEQVTAGVRKKIWWLGDCTHEWDAYIYSRKENDKGCPVCSGHRVLIGYNDLATVNPSLASQWHPTKNGERTAQQFTLHSNKKVWWQCYKGHEWKTSVSNRSRNQKGAGCRVCSGSISKGEKEIADLLLALGLNVESSNRTILKNKNQELDIYLPEKKVAIEFNGVHWHKERYKGKTHHYDRWLDCQASGVQLWQIWEDDWELRSDIIIKTLQQNLSYSSKEENLTETFVGSITAQQAEKFLNATHIQGYASGLHYLALIDAKDVENIRAVLVLDDESSMEDSCSRIIRYATQDHYNDDFSNLITHAINILHLKSIVAIADNCGADHLLYEGNSFRKESTLPPDYTYFSLRSRKDKSEYPLERFHSDPKLLWEEGLTEMELADLNGLDRIWDAGKTLYRLSI